MSYPALLHSRDLDVRAAATMAAVCEALRHLPEPQCAVDDGAVTCTWEGPLCSVSVSAAPGRVSALALGPDVFDVASGGIDSVVELALGALDPVAA